MPRPPSLTARAISALSTVRDGAGDAAARILRMELCKGCLQTFSEVFHVVCVQGSLQITQILLETLLEDQ
jgi:hypothetical protein